MRVISKSTLRAFWSQHEHTDSAVPLQAWHKVAKHADWINWADVKRSYSTASKLGNCVVFNIGGNKYRLATRIIYPKHRVYVLKVMTHHEYDDGDSWQESCGCFRPPPKKHRKKQ